MFEKMNENARQREEDKRRLQARKQKLLDMPEKELLVELLLEIEQIGDEMKQVSEKLDDIGLDVSSIAINTP